jgi:hydroxymethylpyrimidine pyrophosphatase-like HAD family hydrolase
VRCELDPGAEVARAAGEPDAGPGYFHAVAVDFDGTLTEAGCPGPSVLAALDEARASGRRIVIVTGRIVAELQAVFPDAGEHADLIVAENGSVLTYRGRCRFLAAPVPGELADALTARGVACRRGEILLACSGADETPVLEEVRRLGLECQLIRNRAELMVLPPGVSKGAGLAAGLAELGISVHNTVAIGDAENDHSLLAAAELGVAVGDAVGALKATADIVQPGADGQAVASFLRGPVLAGRQHVHPRRWRITLGTLADGTPVTIPASQVNVLITGVPQSGKSYAAGLIAEQLIRLGYSVVIFDPEGDHAGLGQLRNVIVTGSGGNLPSAQDLGRVVRHHSGGVVVDLSAAPADQRSGYLEAAHRELELVRAATGLPHWLIIDEAQVPLARDARAFFEPAMAGYCLITHRPEDLRPEVLLAVDVLIVLPGDDAAASLAELVAAAGTMPHVAAAALISRAGPGQAVLVNRERPGTGAVLTIGQRETAHMRHWHKYSGGHLDQDRRFYFRRGPHTPVGVTAGSAGELQHQLRVCDDAVIVHHCQHGDFSRWVADVLGDPPLAAAIAAAEDAVRTGAATAADARASLTDVIGQRYTEASPADHPGRDGQ